MLPFTASAAPRPLFGDSEEKARLERSKGRRAEWRTAALVRRALPVERTVAACAAALIRATVASVALWCAHALAAAARLAGAARAACIDVAARVVAAHLTRPASARLADAPTAVPGHAGGLVLHRLHTVALIRKERVGSQNPWCVLAVRVVALCDVAIADVHGDVAVGGAVPGVEKQITRDATRPVLVVAVGRVLLADLADLIPLRKGSANGAHGILPKRPRSARACVQVVRSRAKPAEPYAH